MAAQDLSEYRACSKCKQEKPITCYGTARTVAGQPLHRAECRDCYNAHRRAHYSMPAVKAEKRTKRQSYEARIGLAVKRKLQRVSDPVLRDKEKRCRDEYRSRPEVKVRLQEYRKAYVSRPEKKAPYLFSAVKLRAEKKGLPFNLTLDWIAERVLSGRCELTGLPFDYGLPPNGWCYNPSSPSVDQIVPGGGYTKDNCRVILTALNNALSQYGEEYFAHMSAAFLKKRSG